MNNDKIVALLNEQYLLDAVETRERLRRNLLYHLKRVESFEEQAETYCRENGWTEPA